MFSQRRNLLATELWRRLCDENVAYLRFGIEVRSRTSVSNACRRLTRFRSWKMRMVWLAVPFWQDSRYFEIKKPRHSSRTLMGGRKVYLAIPSNFEPSVRFSCKERLLLAWGRE